MNDASKLVYLAVICFSFSACRLFNNVSDLDEISDQKNEFVYVEDGVFKLKGEEFSFFGSNFYRLALGDAFQSNVIKEYRDGKPFFPQIDKVMENYATEGVKVVRMWGFSCEGSMPLGKPPLLKNDFTLDHTAWEQLDFVIDSAGRHGLRIILPLVNFEHEYCGMQWWVDNTAKNIGNPSSQGFTKSCYDKGSHRLTKVVWNDSDCGPNSEAKFSKEQFYTNNAVWEKYSTYLTTILNRENPYNGLPLKDNPTILAIEVANEPHTSDSYECLVSNIGSVTADECMRFGFDEYKNKFTPGVVVYNWLKKVTEFIKKTDKNHLISSGEEGYRVGSDKSECWQKHTWIHNGLKGVDFALNATIPTLDFMTTHLYPDNWGIPRSDLSWFDRCVIQDRANIAKYHKKPIILEESGFSEVAYNGKPDDYRQHRGYFLSLMFAMTSKAGYQGTMVWQSAPLTINDAVAEDDTFTFPIKERIDGKHVYTPEGKAVKLQIQCIKETILTNRNQCIHYCQDQGPIDDRGMGRLETGEICTNAP